MKDRLFCAVMSDAYFFAGRRRRERKREQAYSRETRHVVVEALKEARMCLAKHKFCFPCGRFFAELHELSWKKSVHTWTLSWLLRATPHVKVALAKRLAAQVIGSNAVHCCDTQETYSSSVSRRKSENHWIKYF